MIKRFWLRKSPFELSPAWKIFSYSLLLLWAFIILFPFYWMLVTAFKLPIDVSERPKYIPWVDFKPTTYAYDQLIRDETAGNLVTRPYSNTFSVATTSSVIALLIGSLAAYALMRFNYRVKPGLIATFGLCVGLAAYFYFSLDYPLAVAILIPVAIYILVAQTIGRRFPASLGNSDIAFWLVSQRMLPPVSVIVPIYVMYQQLGWLNTRHGLIVAYIASNLPLVIWFMRDYFSAIPIELEESAFIDGASRYQVLWRIVLPLAVPGLIATFIIVLIFAWNEYTMAVFLTGADTQTMRVLVVAQNATRGPQWWNISLLVLMMVGPIVLLSILLERFIARGLLLGAVKG
jgi:multiple sugar transport system permease protein